MFPFFFLINKKEWNYAPHFTLGHSVNPSVHLDDLSLIPRMPAFDQLEFRFVQGYTADEMVLENWNDFINRRIGHKSVTYPDSIRFSRKSELVKKNQELAPTSVLCEVPPNGSCEQCFFYIDSREAPVFIRALCSLQEGISPLKISVLFFSTMLKQLVENRYLTDEEAKNAFATVRSTWSIEEYVQGVLDSRDFQKALSLALYYRDVHDDPYHFGKALLWLSSAQDFLGSSCSIRKYIDLEKFLQPITMLRDLDLYDSHGDVLEAIQSSPFITILRMDDNTNYSMFFAQRIGGFLARSPSIEICDFSSAPNAYNTRLNAETFTPIAEALKANKTVREVSLVNTQIGDKGVLKLIEAIRANPDSKISKLNLASCGMSDRSAGALLQLIRDKEQITWVNVQSNPGLSESFRSEISNITDARIRLIVPCSFV